MLRNLRMKKNLSSRPTRHCWKKTGPLETSLMKRAMRIIRGSQRGRVRKTRSGWRWRFQVGKGVARGVGEGLVEENG